MLVLSSQRSLIYTEMGRFTLPLWLSATLRSQVRPSAHKPTRPWKFSNQQCPRTTNLSSFKQSYFPPTQHVIAVFTALAITGTVIYKAPVLHADAPPLENKLDEQELSKAKTFRWTEIRKHGSTSETPWVTRGNRVYDITEWVSVHPGGEVILQAAGGSIDRYWDIFSIHQKQDVYDILESYFIGEVDSRDLEKFSGEVDDPFVNDPERDARLHVLADRPYNAETPNTALDAFTTPNSVFYARNHLWVPVVDETKHRLTVELPDGTEREYLLKELKEKFEEVTITSTLQCSGNRRKHMNENAQATTGLPWSVGGISNAEWAGVRLRDVLADAGFPVDHWPDDVKHAQFMGSESYGASIPIEKAVDRRGDVLLAYKMNGETLPPDHGYPIRVLVPGTAAARSVKWVNRIVLSEEESASQWQQRDYKCFGPNIGSSPDWSSAPAIQEMPVQSAITSLRDLSRQSKSDQDLLKGYGSEEDCIAVEGYSFSGGGREIIRVDISTNGGRTWNQADFLTNETKGCKKWAWKRWRYIVPKSQVGGGGGEGGAVFVVKAVDEAYNTQPESYEAQWNARGNLTSGWHRVVYQDKR